MRPLYSPPRHGVTVPPHLIAVPPLEGPGPEDQGPPRDQVTFCSHCGARTGGSSVSRVCRRCEMGLLLHARPELAPGPGDAFVVCDADLRVCALSRGAEQLLGAFEPAVIHAPLGDLVAGVSRDIDGTSALPRLLRKAAAGQLGIERTIVSLAGLRDATWPARVGACGRPPAALLVIDAPVP